MYFVLLSFITNPLLTAACLIFVTTSSVAVTDHPSISTSSARAIHWLVLLKIILLGSVCIFFITFFTTILNSAVDSASPHLKPLSVPNAWIHLNPAVSFLLSSLISLGSRISYNHFLLSQRPVSNQ
jgi:H+/Cl- antiporter ClcA